MATDMKKKLEAADLAAFTGTEHWYKHWLGRAVYTDGVRYVAENAGAYWLIDEIAINQSRPKIKAETFQVWELEVDLEKRRGVLTCDDGDGHIVFTKEIEFTDFPLNEIKLYCTDGVILLPSEY